MDEIKSTVLRVITEQGTPYGAEIWRATNEALGYTVSIGAIYGALEALEEQRLIHSWDGEATPERGGRPKRHYATRPRSGDYW